MDTDGGVGVGRDSGTTEAAPHTQRPRGTVIMHMMYAQLMHELQKDQWERKARTRPPVESRRRRNRRARAAGRRQTT